MTTGLTLFGVRTAGACPKMRTGTIAAAPTAARLDELTTSDFFTHGFP